MMNKRRQTRSPRLLYLALAAVALGPTAPPLQAQGSGKRVIELPGTKTLGIGTSPSKAAMAKVGQDLLALYAEYQAHLKDTSGQGAAAAPFKSSNAIAPVAGGSVVIDATASGDPRPLPPICPATLQALDDEAGGDPYQLDLLIMQQVFAPDRQQKYAHLIHPARPEWPGKPAPCHQCLIIPPYGKEKSRALRENEWK